MSVYNASRKRSRDLDSDSEDEGRYTSKHRPWFVNTSNHGHLISSLAQRPSSTPSPPRVISDLEAMTPAHSDYGSDHSPECAQYALEPQMSQSSERDIDMDVDMREPADSSYDASQPVQSFGNSFMRPAKLDSTLWQSTTLSNNPRIATPMYSTFRRNGNSNMPQANSSQPLNRLINTTTPLHALTLRDPTRLPLNSLVDRPIPSPISEADDLPDTPTALTESRLSRLSFTNSQIASVDDALMDTGEVSPTILPSPSTPRGRKRSGAFTGMGRFAMGYREDCEKCRMNVPGHYSHFLS